MTLSSLALEVGGCPRCISLFIVAAFGTTNDSVRNERKDAAERISETHEQISLESQFRSSSRLSTAIDRNEC
jgi:hypothetical protein